VARKTEGGVPAPTLKIIAWSVIGVCALVAALLVYNRIERFLLRDSRFALTGGYPSEGAKSLEIEGATHASARAVEAVFSEDMGRSVYSIPLGERRASLREVDWVKDASIARMWPNRLQVHVEERVPVAFVTLSSRKSALIDEDGVILPPAAGRFGLPVLSGVSSKDRIEVRKDRVRRMTYLLHELGDQGRNLSEIDVSDPDDVKIMEPRDGRILKLLLGDRDFALRYRNFTSHYSDIVERLPGAVTLDLRLEDRITVVE
jgi:cell division protein FtsQ